MKILYISSHDLVGQQFNGYLLLNAMRKMDIDARMYVHNLRVNKPDVLYSPNSPSVVFLNRILSRLERELSLHAILPVHSVNLMRNSFYKEADIIHLQLIHASQFFSLLSLPRMGREKKLVLTLHDPWMLTGHCIYPMECERWKTGCGHCPDLNRPVSIKTDTTAFMYKVKEKVMQETKIHFVVASRWMDQMAANSPILSHLPRSIIPFGLDTQIFKPLDKKMCRQILGLPEESFIVAFRSVPYSFKGLEYIEKALLNLSSKKPISIITLDSAGLIPNLDNKFKILELGWVNHESDMAIALSAADVFLMPSIAEAFGMMAVESMACGTPVIVFEGTALPGVIQAPRGGIAVPSKDWKALKAAIENLMENTEFYGDLVRNGLEIVNEEYMVEKYVARHLDLYNRLIAPEID